MEQSKKKVTKAWMLEQMTTLFDLKIPKATKLKELEALCQEKGILSEPEPEFYEKTLIRVYKCSINTAFQSIVHDKLKADVESYVTIISRMYRRTSLIMLYHFTKLLSSNDIDIPNLFLKNQTYWKNWLMIGIKGCFPDKDSKKSFEELNIENMDFIVDQFPVYFDQVLSYAAITFSTVVTNNVWVPLFPRLARLTKATIQSYNLKNVSAFDVINTIRSAEPNIDDFKDPRIKDYIVDVRTRLGAIQGVYIHDEWGKDENRFILVLQFNYWMQKSLETLAQKRIRLMPVFNVRRAHVRLDKKTLVAFAKRTILGKKDDKNTTLKDASKYKDPSKTMFTELDKVALLKKKTFSNEEDWQKYKQQRKQYEDEVKKIMATDEYKEKQQEYEQLIKAKEDICNMLFNPQVLKKATKGWKFDCSIVTDGVSVSLQYSKTITLKKFKEKKINNKQQKDKNDEPKVIEADWNRQMATNFTDENGTEHIVLGLDPGRTNISTIRYYYVDSTNNNIIKKGWKYTRGQYYKEARITKMNKIQQQRIAHLKLDNLGDEQTALKTSDPSIILNYLQRYKDVCSDWWKIALARRESWDSLKRYMNKRSAIEQFYANIATYMKKTFPEAVVTVAYGASGINMKPTGKGEVAVPTNTNYKLCCKAMKDRGYQVKVQDEFRSTMIDWETGKKSDRVYVRSVDSKNKVNTLGHTSDNTTPYVSDDDVEMIRNYNHYLKEKGKRRRGGSSSEDYNDDESKRLRYPEIRGLRFCQETSKFYDRDLKASLTIGRLCVCKLQGIDIPYPFNRKYKLDASKK